jgi:sulfide:quinone oxidoreductase
MLSAKKGQQERISYDYLINATGPRLAFDQTEGLNPGENEMYSVCTYGHAQHAAEGLKLLEEKLKNRIKIESPHRNRTSKGNLPRCSIRIYTECRK